MENLSAIIELEGAAVEPVSSREVEEGAEETSSWLLILLLGWLVSMMRGRLCGGLVLCCLPWVCDWWVG